MLTNRCGWFLQCHVLPCSFNNQEENMQVWLKFLYLGCLRDSGECWIMGAVTGSRLHHLVDWDQAKQKPFTGPPWSSAGSAAWEATAWKKVWSFWWINQLNISLLWNVTQRVMYEYGNCKMEYGLRVSLVQQQQLLECCILRWCPLFGEDGDELMDAHRRAARKIKTLGVWVNDVRNPALLIKEMLGGRELS